MLLLMGMNNDFASVMKYNYMKCIYLEIIASHKVNLETVISSYYDTPCTIDNQIKLLSNAGFKTVKMNWKMENTTIIIAKK
jgi:histidine ammonia-lyase